MAVSDDFLRTAIALSAAGNPHGLTARGRVMFDVLLMAGAVARSCHPRSVTSSAPAVIDDARARIAHAFISAGKDRKTVYRQIATGISIADGLPWRFGDGSPPVDRQALAMLKDLFDRDIKTLAALTKAVGAP